MKVRMNFEGNRGYGPDQVGGMTLNDLLAEVEEAAEEWGGDTKVVLHQNNNRGANYGTFSRWPLFEDTDVDDEDEDLA